MIVYMGDEKYTYRFKKHDFLDDGMALFEIGYVNRFQDRGKNEIKKIRKT